MEETLIPTPRKNAIPKEVFKDLTLQGRISGGHDSPESGSLYSDYESGQQYEDKDLPSGYNSGEQYDTLSTGYVSGETYELPETRAEPLEPTLACIDEVSVRSDEDMFTLAMPPGFPENNLMVQTEIMESSSSSSINDSKCQELASNIEHKSKRKKTVSYHVSVPIEKSPLGVGDIRYRDIPSDTDTTSCFDSDGTYMRSEGQSSDSGAALLQHSSGGHRKKSRERKSNDSAIIKGSKKGLRKAKKIIRNHEDFFEMYDNKYWAMGRKICFWGSILFILACIIGSAVMIGLMPQTCDPAVEWWQGSIVLDIFPSNSTPEEPMVNLTDLIANVPEIQEAGIQTIKLKNLYLKNPSEITWNVSSISNWYPLPSDDDDNQIIENVFDDFSLFDELATKLHDNGMNLMVEVPVIDNASNGGIMSFDLEQRLTKAVVFWGKHRVDGITLLGLDNFVKDPYLARNVATWRSKFQQYGMSPNTKILTTSYLLPHKIDGMGPIDSNNPDADPARGFKEIVDFSLLDANIALGPVDDNQVMVETVKNATKWDLAPTQPWINWNLRSSRFSKAELAFLTFLPGTITIQQSLEELLDPNSDNLLFITCLTRLRRSAVPIYMNGNFKTCHGHCAGVNEKEENFKIHMLDNHILLLERFFSRRNRYMVISNLGGKNASLAAVASLYSGGELILDTRDLKKESVFVKFKETVLEKEQAIVIKFPK